MTLEFEDHPFWDFSLRVYGGDGVPAACIALQDRHGIDVNVVLFCAWLGHGGHGRLRAEQLGSALAASADWNADIVRGRRAVRARLKEAVGQEPPVQREALRKRILDIEIDCEHVEQLMLAGTVDGRAADGLAGERQAADAVANISAYFDRNGTSPDADDAAQTAVILGAAFGDLDGAAVETLCGGLMGG